MAKLAASEAATSVAHQVGILLECIFSAVISWDFTP